MEANSIGTTWHDRLIGAEVYGGDFATYDEALSELIFALRHAGLLWCGWLVILSEATFPEEKTWNNMLAGKSWSLKNWRLYNFRRLWTIPFSFEIWIWSYLTIWGPWHAVCTFRRWSTRAAPKDDSQRGPRIGTCFTCGDVSNYSLKSMLHDGLILTNLAMDWFQAHKRLDKSGFSQEVHGFPRGFQRNSGPFFPCDPFWVQVSTWNSSWTPPGVRVLLMLPAPGWMRSALDPQTHLEMGDVPLYLSMK